MREIRKLRKIGLILFIACLVGSGIMSSFSHGQKADTIELTQTEMDYIKTHPSIRMVVDPSWYPYEALDEEGTYVGISADVINLISQRTGLVFEIVPTNSWEESLEIAKAGDADVVSCLNQTDERDTWLLFTETYFVDPNVLITREEHDYISNLSRLSGEKMVLPEGSSIEEWIRADYPNLEIIIVASEKEAIAFVDQEKADMTLRSLTMAAYIIKNEGFFNLKIAGEMPSYGNQFKMGITGGDEVLQSILNKGIASISEQELQSIINNHISIKVLKGIDYQLFAIVFSVFSFVLLFSFFWIRKFQKLNKQLSKRQDELIHMSERLLKSEAEYRTIAEELESKNRLLQQVASVDALTGLKNRYSYNLRIMEEIDRAKRYGTQLSLLLIDMDHFKRINDTYGHQAGDDVIRTVASTLQSIIRKVDALARWGGEEFVVLLPGIGLKDANTVAEKLREKVASVVHFDKEVITVSIGVSSFTSQDTLESWFDRTDKALYHAKQEGRNRVCLSERTELSNSDLIDWHREWDTGHNGIDQQHRELLKIANNLIKAMLNNESQISAMSQLMNLLGHIEKHFNYEEQILKEIQYEDYEAHVESHRQLLAKSDEILKKSDSGNLLLSDVVKFVVGDMITLHLLEEDQKFFEALERGKLNG